MNQRRQPGPGLDYSAIGRGLTSPIALMGGHEADEPQQVGAVAVRIAAGEEPEVIELSGRADTNRGTHVYARAPGYEWGRLLVDFSTSGERELLLGQGASLGVQLANVKLERPRRNRGTGHAVRPPAGLGAWVMSGSSRSMRRS